jgi:nitronate monooxygenase
MFRPDNFLQAVVPILQEYRPAAVWLFAAENRAGYADVISTLKTEGKAWGLKIFVQVGSVQGAREAVEDGTDVLVVQGTDAGGHQMAHGASLMTLLPEVVDMLKDEFPNSHISVIAAGGIMDGRGIAAAQALGQYASQTHARAYLWYELIVSIRRPWGCDGNKSMLDSSDLTKRN